MRTAAADLEFEEAARLRDEIRRLEAHELGLDRPGVAAIARGLAGAGTSRRRRRGKDRKKHKMRTRRAG